MIAFVDVHYGELRARAGCVVAAGWRDERPVREAVAEVDVAAEYVSGELYRRELPPILAVLTGQDDLTCIVVDGHAWLGPDRPGLGVHLHRALGERIAVVGVAKNPFVGAPAIPVLRGESARPLWVSAIGLDAALAAAEIATMHGEHRIPTLLRRADHLARGT